MANEEAIKRLRSQISANNRTLSNFSEDIDDGQRYLEHRKSVKENLENENRALQAAIDQLSEPTPADPEVMMNIQAENVASTLTFGQEQVIAKLSVHGVGFLVLQLPDGTLSTTYISKANEEKHEGYFDTKNSTHLLSEMLLLIDNAAGFFLKGMLR